VKQSVKTISLIVATSLAPLAVAQDASRPNPFTGRAAEVESMISQLERERLITQIETEKAAQAKAREDARRTLEGARAALVALAPQATPAPTRAATSAEAPRLPPSNARKPAKPSTPSTGSATAPTPTFVQPPMPPADVTPRLVGTALVDDQWTAMLIVQGSNEILSIPEGQSKSNIRVEQVTQSSAQVNGKRIELARVAGRLQLGGPVITVASPPSLAGKPSVGSTTPSVSPATRPIDLSPSR
jgi:hypothetical protein